MPPELNGPDYVASSTRRWGKEGIGKNVYEAAVDRCIYVMETFEDFYVGFSGGKDSTAMLECALEAARVINLKEPLKVWYLDDEIVAPATEAYIHRCIERMNIDLHWYTIPVKQRNACSVEHPVWYPWAPEDRHLWVKDDIPDGTTHTLENVPWYDGGTPEGRRTVPVLGPYVFHGWQGDAMGSKLSAVMLGIRVDESVMRRNVIASKRDKWAHWIGDFPGAKWCKKVYPIFDMGVDDIWIAANQFGWDYNSVYDEFEMMGVPQPSQRIGTPFGEEPLRSMWQWQIIAPELWDRMLYRVPGALTASMYSRTSLYGKGSQGDTKRADIMPELKPGQRYRDLVAEAVMAYTDEAMRTAMATMVKRLIASHQKRTTEPIVVWTPHPASGVSWLELLRLVIIGDMKSRNQMSLMPNKEKSAKLRPEYDDELNRLRLEDKLHEVS